MPAYWVMKTEPGAYSIDDLERDHRTEWDGVRNYQARNYMRDQMKIGDRILFYHSSTEVPAVVGIAEVCSAPHPDESAFDSHDSHFDPKSTPEHPIWMLVDICFVKKFRRPISLEEIKRHPGLSGIMLAQKGSRLSIQPVSPEHFGIIEQLGL